MDVVLGRSEHASASALFDIAAAFIAKLTEVRTVAMTRLAILI